MESPLETFTYFTLSPIDEVIPPTGHSTCVADKAMGKSYGAAKKLKLVPVLIGAMHSAQVAEAFQAVLDEITEDKSKPSPVRYKKSIVVMSMLYDTEEDVSALVEREPYKSVKNYISKLFDLGVPVILSAGNAGSRIPGRPHQGIVVEGFPATLEAPGFPIINVGNIDLDGSIAFSSRRGPQVTVFAPGQHVICVGPENGESGTSFGKICLDAAKARTNIGL